MTLTEVRAGRGRIVARLESGRTVLGQVRASSPLRFIAPTFPGAAAAALCVVTFGGGMVDGDVVDLDVVVEPGATLLLFTQSTTKIFRGHATCRLRAEVHGTLAYLPDPVACFAGARYTQRIDVDLRGDGGCVLLDGYTSGRAAYGERWAFDAVDARTDLRKDGRLVARDAFVLDAHDGSIASRLDRFDALATVIAAGPAARAMSSTPVVRAVASYSPLPEEIGAIARIAGETPSDALVAARALLRNLPEIGVVDPFGSRY